MISLIPQTKLSFLLLLYISVTTGVKVATACLEDGTQCSYPDTCGDCCTYASYWYQTEKYACGQEPCLVNGTSCIKYGGDCYQCCSPAYAYDDEGRKCGGECLAAGTECSYGTTCNLCCGYVYHWADASTAKCGLAPSGDCWEDGTSCMKDKSCIQCCNGAYLDDGSTCGGECWEDKRECDANTTCSMCCNGYSFWEETGTNACGLASCYEDGFQCGPDQCFHCCNGSYFGILWTDSQTCGGECWEDGKQCELFGTCDFCCNLYTQTSDLSHYQCGQENCFESGTRCDWPNTDTSSLYGVSCDSCCDSVSWYNRDHFECGEEPCLEDGNRCILFDECYKCCNGAFKDNGYTCGGKCLDSGTECQWGVNCDMCCDGYSYWYSKGNHTCGYEVCLEDGEDCVPGTTCLNCCNGAWENEGKTCGGDCLPDGKECDQFTTCETCCSESVHWVQEDSTHKCGSAPCIPDGTECIPEHTCNNCCNGTAYDNNGFTCGGECWKEGKPCNSVSACSSLCCSQSGYYSFGKSTMVCAYNGLPHAYVTVSKEIGNAANSSNITSSSSAIPSIPTVIEHSNTKTTESASGLSVVGITFIALAGACIVIILCVAIRSRIATIRAK